LPGRALSRPAGRAAAGPAGPGPRAPSRLAPLRRPPSRARPGSRRAGEARRSNRPALPHSAAFAEGLPAPRLPSGRLPRGRTHRPRVSDLAALPGNDGAAAGRGGRSPDGRPAQGGMEMRHSLEGATVLVTGGAGLIGSHIVDRLIDAGAGEIRVL